MAAVVLAGGASRRMGRDKARLPWDGTSLLGHVIAVLRAEFGEVVVSARTANVYSDLGVRVVVDAEPGAGPLCGVASALAATHADWVLVTACDMPFIEAHVWRALATRVSASVDAVVPKTARGIEPLCALYHRRCLSVFRECLRREQYAMHDALQQVRVAEVDVEIAGASDPFVNINTPDEYTSAHERASRRTKASV